MTLSETECDDLAESLRTIVGPDHVLTRPELRASYERDFTGRFGGDALMVVRPGDGVQVSHIVESCASRGIGIVPQGGNTGLVGGGVPRKGEVLVSLARLDAVGTVDEVTGQLLVGAGATLATVQKTALQAGWEMPLDLGARDSATVGGLVATDAGGSLTVAHGTMRERVAGLCVVMPSGAIVERLAGLRKDNAGYSWSSLLVGSEGTLGIVTEILLRLIPLRPKRVAALFAVRDAVAATELVTRLVRAVPSIEAADFFFDEGVDLVARTLDKVKLQLSRRAGCYVVVECAAIYDPIEELSEAAEAADDLIVDQAAATENARRRKLWQIREALPEALVRAGVPVKIDVAVPIRAIAGFCDEVTALVPSVVQNAETILWGHLGDGNVHVNILGAAERADQVEEAVLRLAAEHGGTVSAEHGVGVSKAHYLDLVCSPEELTILRELKNAFDPGGIMNPGVVLSIR